MGILIRFRSTSILKKLNLNSDSKKIVKSICFFVVALIIPYLTRGELSPLLMNRTGISFSTLGLSMALLVKYFCPVSKLYEIASTSQDHWKKVGKSVWRVCARMYRPFDRVERGLLKLKNLGTMLNQIVFFLLCDMALVPGHRVMCLYTLMFYNVLAYCVSYIKEQYEKEDWSPYVNITDHSNLKHLAMSATKMVLEWTKAVTFIITVVFMLLVFGLEQGLEHYKPTLSYTVISLFYYLITEKVFVELLINLVVYLQIPSLENLEKLWVATTAQILTAAMSLALIVTLLFWGEFRTGFACLYVNVYLKLKGCFLTNFLDLSREIKMLGPYRFATNEELGLIDDVCAVCLNPMKLARITPCHHIFHGDCLRNCLKTSNHCPICKRELKFD